MCRVYALLLGDEDSDVLPYPAQVPAKKTSNGDTEKHKFFVLTAVEAHAAKLKYRQEKQRKQQEKEQKRKEQELKRQEKESGVLSKKNKGKRVAKKAPKDGTHSHPKHRKSASCACTGCGIVENSKEDLDKGEGWIKCKYCSHWYHDGCAENFGILDDLYFYCHNCLSS